MINFSDVKAKAIKTIDKDLAKYFAKRGKYSEYDLRDKAAIVALNDFPDNDVALLNVDVKYKAIFLKAHLMKNFPDAVIKVRINRFSMGSSIDAWVDGANVDEALASKIGSFYSNPGKTDLMTDYFDYDNYVSVMCKNGGVMNSPVVILGKAIPA